MRLDRDAIPFVTALALPAAVLAASGRRGAAAPVAAAAVAVGAFFRDPDRRCDTVAPDPDEVVAPADGIVMVAGAAEAGVAPPGDWGQVSIFLTLADVHVNRAPYGGVVVRTDHRPGRYLAAFRAASGRDNERTEIWLAGPRGRTVVVRQVVGLLARRIVLRARLGATLRAGERIGLMRFGSRMDVFLPPDCTVLVSRGERVRGGETVIARW